MGQGQSAMVDVRQPSLGVEQAPILALMRTVDVDVLYQEGREVGGITVLSQHLAATIDLEEGLGMRVG